MTNVAGCPFCEIATSPETDAREVYRDDQVVAFFPTDPATLGHTLVVPRQHVPDIWTLSRPLGEKIAGAVLELARAIREAVEPDGMNVIQSNGEAATQTVPHLHVHIVPRWNGDSIGRIWPPATNYSERQKDGVLQLVRQALQRERL